MNNKKSRITQLGIFFILLTNSSYATSYSEKLVNAAIERTYHKVTYDGSYRRIAFPFGDVPNDRGVCK